MAVLHYIFASNPLKKMMIQLFLAQKNSLEILVIISSTLENSLSVLWFFFFLWSHMDKFKTAPMQAVSKLLQAYEPYQTDLKDYCAAALKKQEWGETEVNCHTSSSLADLPTLPQLVSAHSKA